MLVGCCCRRTLRTADERDTQVSAPGATNRWSRVGRVTVVGWAADSYTIIVRLHLWLIFFFVVLPLCLL